MIQIISSGLVFLSIYLSGASLQTESAASTISGTWYAEENYKSLIKIYREGDYFVGKIIESEQEGAVGHYLIKEGVLDTANNTLTGKIHPYNKGIELGGTLSLDAPDRLKVVGTKFFMSRTYHWERR